MEILPKEIVFSSCFMVTQSVKSLLAMWETWVQSLGQEDPLEKKMNPLQYTPEKSHGLRSFVGF